MTRDARILLKIIGTKHVGIETERNINPRKKLPQQQKRRYLLRQ